MFPGDLVRRRPRRAARRAVRGRRPAHIAVIPPRRARRLPPAVHHLPLDYAMDLPAEHTVGDPAVVAKNRELATLYVDLAYELNHYRARQLMWFGDMKSWGSELQELFKGMLVMKRAVDEIIQDIKKVGGAPYEVPADVNYALHVVFGNRN